MWEPENPPKGVIVLVHGFGEHSGRYGTHFAEHFSKEGFSIITFDLLGHGKTGGKRGHINKFEDILKLISAGISFSKKEYTGLPIFLYGHGFGGMIVLFYSIQEEPVLNGVIATSPLLKLYGTIPSKKLTLINIMNKIYPSFTLDNELNREMLSRDSSVVDRYNADPLVHGDASVRSAMYIIEKGTFVRDNAEKVPLPTLVMYGSSDRIVSVTAIHDFC